MSIQSDTNKTGNLYLKLDAFCLAQVDRYSQVWGYMCSSCQFRTMKGFKEFLEQRYPGREIEIRRGE